MNIGVITLPFSPNFGWLMQAFAMQKVLEKSGHKVMLIQRKWNVEETNRGLLHRILRPVYYNIACGGLYRFYNKHLKMTRVYRSNDELKDVVHDYKLDVVIVGSDQVWRIEDTRGVGYNFFLDFVPNGVIKLSYAASFGNDTWTGSKKDNEIISQLLSGFSGISVREDSGISICKQYFEVIADCCIDPTFLLTKEDYDKVLKNPNKFSGEKLLSTYILDPSCEKMNLINSVAHEMRLTVSHLYPVDRRFRFHILKKMTEWLLKIRNSKFVIVDSFHGMVFCLLFHKDFIVIANKNRGNARFESVLAKLDLMDRLIFDCKLFNHRELHSIDYNMVDNILSHEREHAMAYLHKSLNAKINA